MNQVVDNQVVNIDAEFAEMKRRRMEREGLSVIPGTPNRTGNGVNNAAIINSTRLRPLNLESFLSLAIKPREMILNPIIPEKGLAMLYASRGTGKTHVALGIAYAVATGTKFLRWNAPKPRRVLLIDGEMPAAALQERLASIVASAPNNQFDPGNIRILAGDLIEEAALAISHQLKCKPNSILGSMVLIY